MFNLNFINKKWFIVILVLVVSLILAARVRLQVGKNNTTQSTVSPKQELEKKVKAPLPEVVKKDNAQISATELSRDLPGLLPAGASRISGASVMYEKGYTGLLVKYWLKGDQVMLALQALSSLAKQNGWDPLQPVSSGNSGFFEAKRNGIQALLQVTVLPDKILAIQIQTIALK